MNQNQLSTRSIACDKHGPGSDLVCVNDELGHYMCEQCYEEKTVVFPRLAISSRIAMPTVPSSATVDFVTVAQKP